MGKVTYLGFLLLIGSPMMAAINLISESVKVEKIPGSTINYFITVVAHNNDSTSSYEAAFDLYPSSKSIAGTFSIEQGNIGYVSSYVHKTRANSQPADLWYYCEENSATSLTITVVNDSTCTLSGSIQATSASGTAYTYHLSSITFAYKDDQEKPDPKDPYRFEPKNDTSFVFKADLVAYRQQDGYINITLNEMEDSTYDWVDINLMTDTLAWPAGTYTIDTTRQKSTLTASRGYLSSKEDDPCFVALRGEDWGAYTPYYLVGGTVTVAYNAKGDTIFVSGKVYSKNGSEITLNVKSYNALYVPGEDPREPEFVTLDIDTVAISYLREKADTLAGIFPYTFVFEQGEDFPQVILDVLLPSPMALSEGTYTLQEQQLSGILLFQDQTDFTYYLLYGETYEWDSVALTMTQLDATLWQFDMLMKDTIGSEYSFTLVIAPSIVNYPEPAGLPVCTMQPAVAKKVMYNGQIEIWRGQQRYSIIGKKM